MGSRLEAVALRWLPSSALKRPHDIGVGSRAATRDREKFPGSPGKFASLSLEPIA
jgi:hypothetical protein